MKRRATHTRASGLGQIWIIRAVLFVVPCLIAYGAWQLSEHLFGAETDLGRLLNWIATLALLTVLLQLFNLLVIDLPRARTRARFRAQKKTTSGNDASIRGVR
jgi:hypothetical protein